MEVYRGDIFKLQTATIFFQGYRENQLFNIRNLLNRLLEPHLPNNDWARLFCRQLKRLMDHNKSQFEHVLSELHEDILCVLGESNGEEDMNSNSNNFLKRMSFEEKREQRELKFKQIIGEQKSLSELVYEHKEFFEKYLQKCIDFHSKVQVQGLIENIDDLLYRIYGLTEVSLTLESRQLLSEKLKCIDIPIDCSNRSLNSLGPKYFRNHTSSQRVNNDPSSFLPSQRTNMGRSNEPEIIENALGSERWIVILGDPGSAKTTLLRWILCRFTAAVQRGQETVDFEGHDRLPVRVPILIRVGEFAVWLAQYPTKTLMDYIGEHTWFSERYCDDKGGRLLKELIYHGHALILLDGLDEISEVERRGEIVDLVREFVDEYVTAPNFVSAFDDRVLISYINLAEKELPNKSGGNQIVVTSRIVGYQFYPLNNTYIRHYTLSLMDHQEANEFVKNWMRQVHKSVRDVLLNEGIKLDGQAMKTSSTRRNYTDEAIFVNSLKLLKSNPSLLSLICIFIFQSSIEFRLNSRVEVYNYAVQSALRTWKSQESSISESVLNNFLIDLATYLHLQSSSGLIDAFDLEHLCCLTLKQQGVSNNRRTLHAYANKIISLLESNIAIVAEKGLQVFGFLHLSFQEYFVAQIFVRGSDIEKVAERILSFAIKPRFRESILLAFGWISWKWPFDKYDKFCNFIVTQAENHTIPFGTLLFFDAIDDMHRLPSNWVIFIALSNLLNHPSYQIKRTYFMPSLSKLPENIIIEWMRLHLKEDKYLLKFCQSFLIETFQKSVPSAVYQQLWSFHNRSSSTEFLIDQTLRRTMISVDVPEQIFNKDLSAYLLSHNIYASNIHPLIASVIIAVCGGIFFKHEDGIIKIDFSSKRMYRESSILAPVIEYFDNNEESHLTKDQILIEQYESVLQKSSPSDSSVDIVDIFIALLCLQGLSQPLIYEKYAGYQALPLALERLRRIWFYFKESCKISRYDCSMPSDIESIMNMFFAQANQSEEQCTSFLLACETVWKKLGMRSLSKRLNINISHNSKVGRYFQCQREFTYIVSEEKLNRIVNDIYSLQMFETDLFFSITFLPQPLQQLYYCTTISPTNNADSLPLVVFLSQCLTYFEHIDKDNVDPFLTISMLHPLFKEYMLENYARVMFWENDYGDEFVVNDYENEFLVNDYGNEYVINDNGDEFVINDYGNHFVVNNYEEVPNRMTDREKLYKAMKDRKLLDPFLINRPKGWEMFINEECQRIDKLKYASQNEEKDVGLFAASISLARLFQAKYRSRKYRATKVICLTSTESKEVCIAITNIFDPVLRIIAFSTILEMKDPLIFDVEQRDQLLCEMISLLQSLLPRVSLLTSVLLFIHCHTARHLFPVPFQYMTSVIGNKLSETSTDKQGQEQEAAYIALRYLNNSDLSPYLSEFAKQKQNFSDLLEFNSTTFYRYFANTTSFDSSNPILLSMMYLVELAFDAQILDMYTITPEKNKNSSLAELTDLWDDLSKYQKIMTFQVASWITNYLHTSDKQKIHHIIEDVSSCSIIERKALPVIEKWLDYRTNKDLRFFAHYAALQLIAEGSSMPSLIDVIEEIFLTDRKFHLRSLMECLFTSRFVNLTVLRQILIILHRNNRYSSSISVVIDRKEIFELILQLELEQTTTNVRKSSETLTKSFLSLFKGCSEDLQIYLAEHLREFVDKYDKVDDTIKAEYIAIVIKWIIKRSVSNETKEYFAKELYNYIFVLLHDGSVPRFQKVILNALNSLFSHPFLRRENIFVQDDAITNLEKMICSWNTYSEDVVAICLLAYGNCLLILERLQIGRNISDEMKNVLINLFKISSSEIISIRANFCLIFSHRFCITRRTIPNWFKGESNRTCAKMYKILLQKTLFELDKQSIMKGKNQNEYPDMIEGFVCAMECDETNEIVEHIEAHFAELIDKFITDLYNYLCNNDTRKNFSDPVPNYVKIANKLCEKKVNEFCDAIRKSSFGEEEFKRRLCLCRKNKSRDIQELIELYCVFGTVTFEMLDMMERIEDDKATAVLLRLPYLKQVSDEETMEKLFRLINSTPSKTKLEISSNILRCLARIDAVSLLEVHQKISLINNVSDDHGEGWRSSVNIIFDLLSSFGCFQKSLSAVPEECFFTMTDIDEEFEKKM